MQAHISGVEALEGTMKALGLAIDLRAFFCTKSLTTAAVIDQRPDADQLYTTGEFAGIKSPEGDERWQKIFLLVI
jgi:hypothetical protein